MRMIPGDVCQLKLAGSGAFFDQRSLDICRLELGLDEPIFLQFFQWVGGWFVGDFGTSMWTGKPVSEEIAVRFQVSLQIALMSTLFAVILSIPLGIASARSEEHTSELQSLMRISYAVFCLTKKKIN